VSFPLAIAVAFCVLCAASTAGQALRFIASEGEPAAARWRIIFMEVGEAFLLAWSLWWTLPQLKEWWRA